MSLGKKKVLAVVFMYKSTELAKVL